MGWAGPQLLSPTPMDRYTWQWRSSSSIRHPVNSWNKICSNKSRCLHTWHISVMVSSKTPPASSAPSPTSLTFQALEGSRRSEAFNFTTCRAICTKIGLHFRPLQSSNVMENQSEKEEGDFKFTFKHKIIFITSVADEVVMHLFFYAVQQFHPGTV